jgi:MerR family transcriptional regulator/heat shock protein HspR
MELNYFEPVFSISTAAKLLDVSVHTLRMYEREGLIIPFKKDSSQRLYSRSDIDRVECIRRAINESKISIAGIKTIFAMIPCYKIKMCNEKRHACSAYTVHSKPCWTLKHDNNFCTGKDCRTCEVYMQYANCQTIKEKFFELLTA